MARKINMNKRTILIAVISGLIVGGIVWAAFPDSLTNFNEGDILTHTHMNNIEATIGATGSVIQTSHDYLIRNASTSLYALQSISGDILYHDGNRWQRLASSTVGQVLKIDANGWPTWGAVVGTVAYLSDIGDVTAATSTYGTLVYWDGLAWDEIATSSLNIHLGDIVDWYATTTWEGNLTVAGAIVGDTLDTGQGVNELYDMDQNVLTTSAVTFLTVDTGQGAYELYAMDQNVRIVDSPTFAGVTMTVSTTTGSLVIPQGAAPAADYAGEIAVDTTSDQFQYYGTDINILMDHQEKCLTMTKETWGAISTSTVLWRPYKAITIFQTSCDNGGDLIDQGTTTMYFSDGVNNMDMMTCGYAQIKDTALTNNSWVADEPFIWTLNSINGTPNFFNACIYYKYTAD